MMARKVIDTAKKAVVRRTQGEDQAAKKLLETTLAARIKLTDEVRLGGNDAAHEEEPFEEDDAKKLVEYTKPLLTQFFTIPAMVDELHKPRAVANK